MYSQTTRLFSQGGEMSQYTSPLSSQQNTISDDDCNTQRQREEVAESYNEAQGSQAEEPLSVRADVICEQNRKIRGFVEKSLKQIEKKRIKLTNAKTEIEKQINTFKEKRKCQSQQSVDLQMNVEEMAEKYQSELNERENLKDKLKHTQIVVDYFAEHCSEIPKVTADLEKAKQDLSLEFEKLSANLKAKEDEKNKLKLSCHSQMQEIARKAEETKEHLIKERVTGVHKIQTLVVQNVENQDKLNDLQQDISSMMSNRTELNNSFDELTLQNKSLKEGVEKRYQQVDQLKAASATQKQNLKLQINNEQNNNSNLQVKFDENEHSINITSIKEKELLSLCSQMNLAVEETAKTQRDKQQEVQECKDQEEVLCNEIQTLAEEMQKYENAPNLNTFFKSEILKLEERNNAKENVLLERQESVKKIHRKKEELKKTSTDIQANIQQMNNELENSKLYKDELDSKIKEDQINNQTEREAKTLQNKTLEQVNVELATKVENLTCDLEEARGLNNKMKSDKIEISELIEQYNERIQEASEKLKINISEWEDKLKAFNESIDLKKNELNKIKELIVEGRPCQAVLAKLSIRKEALCQDILLQREQYFKDKESHEHSFNSKMMEICGEMDTYTSIMKGLIKAEEDAADKLKEETKRSDIERKNLEADLRNCFQEITNMKNEEQIKRNTVVKLEKRLRTITKEIKVTRQDISDAITGNVKKPSKVTSSKKLMRPTSSSDSYINLQEPPQKKMATPQNVHHNSLVYQINTKQWVESVVQEDEYEFSDV